jgi:hypothetical protein
LTVLVDAKHGHVVLSRSKVGRELGCEVRITLVVATERGRDNEQTEGRRTTKHEDAR